MCRLTANDPDMQPLMTLLWLVLGGAVGTVARFGVSELVARIAGREAVPLGTLLVNIMGCLVIGYAAADFVGERRAAFALLENRPLVVTGFCGAFTTFSAFGFEVLDLWQRRGPAWAVGLIALHLVLGVTAVALGQRMSG